MVKLLRPSTSKGNNYPEDSIPHATQILYSQLTATEKLQSSRAEGLLFLHGLESNPGSSLQTEEEAGLP